MIRNERRERALCPHCRVVTAQTFLLAADPLVGVRWSTCERCHQTSIWEGAISVFPSLEQRAV